MQRYLQSDTGLIQTVPQMRRTRTDTSIPDNPTDVELGMIGYERLIPTTPPDMDVVELAGYTRGEDGLAYEKWTGRDFTPDEVEAMRPPPKRYYTIKARVWDAGRVSDEDFDILDEAVSSLSRRLSNQWRDAVFLYHDDEPYLTLRANLAGKLPQEKIDNIFREDGYVQD